MGGAVATEVHPVLRVWIDVAHGRPVDLGDPRICAAYGRVVLLHGSLYRAAANYLAGLTQEQKLQWAQANLRYLDHFGQLTTAEKGLLEAVCQTLKAPDGSVRALLETLDKSLDGLYSPLQIIARKIGLTAAAHAADGGQGMSVGGTIIKLFVLHSLYKLQTAPVEA